jgi:hypothetical protein
MGPPDIKPLSAKEAAPMPQSNQNFEQALTLIERLMTALSDADTHAQQLNKVLIQKAVAFLEKEGRSFPQFEE